jgi:hypothetical protein
MIIIICTVEQTVTCLWCIYITRRKRRVGHVAHSAEMRNRYKSLVEKKSIRRPRQRWQDNIKTGLTGVWLNGVKWIHLAQDNGPAVDSCEHGNELS